MKTNRPVIGISACRRPFMDRHIHGVLEQYLAAIGEVAEAIPVMLPAMGDAMLDETVLDRLDGVFLTGSPSNIEAHHYGGVASLNGSDQDPQRDATTLGLVPQVIKRRMPLLGVCRGLQEINVAFGGTLYQRVHEQEGYDDHRDDHDQPLEQRFAPAHEVSFERGGLLHSLTGSTTVMVNSLHGQGIQTLGKGLLVEARARDGLVEAFRVGDAPGFTLAVQWHPEWMANKNPVSMAIFSAFGDAARNYAKQR
jgi:putative glutamine amidotransferase